MYGAVAVGVRLQCEIAQSVLVTRVDLGRTG